MKRCSNCGWFNLDTSSQCEKCGEESFEPVVESNETIATELPIVEDTPNIEVKEDVKLEQPVEAPKSHFTATIAFGSDKVAPVKVEKPKAKENLQATVAFGSKPNKPVPVVEEVKPVNNFKATVAIGSDQPVQSVVTVKETVKSAQQTAEAVPVKCPKCCYPITGYVEYCPNCGATIKNAPKPVVVETTPQSYSQTVDRNLAKTVRDFSSCLKNTVAERVEDDVASEAYRLVNIDASDVPAVEVRLGEVFVINGIRYKLEK